MRFVMAEIFHDPKTYRTREEENSWLKKDPILKYEKLLKKEGILEKNNIKNIEDDIKHEIDDAVRFAENSKKPENSELFEDVYKLC